MVHITPFQDRVYAATCQIPKGRVTTYRDLAKMIGCGSSQAVGQALKRNPFAPEVPCHRIVASDRHLGGFMGGHSNDKLAKKRELLLAEGVVFDADGRVAAQHFWSVG